MEPRVLIIDDDRELCALLADFLRLEGFSTHAVHDGAAAIDHCRRHAYDAVVLDIMLPRKQGLEVLRDMRAFSEIPVLMLTARGDDADRILGLELGADDYLPKPCNPRELAARLRAVLRRTRGAEGGARERREREVTVGATHIDRANRRATHGGEDLSLTSAEFDILALLLAQAGQVVDKEHLSRQALGRPLTAYDRSVDVHVSKIRKKLAACGGGDLIVSVRGAGYLFRPGEV